VYKKIEPHVLKTPGAVGVLARWEMGDGRLYWLAGKRREGVTRRSWPKAWQAVESVRRLSLERTVTVEDGGREMEEERVDDVCWRGMF
jgi:hypothetical protein